MKFKCKQSGNIFEFFTEHDIKTMRSHPEYEEVQEQKQEAQEPTVKKVGRPKRLEIPG